MGVISQVCHIAQTLLISLFLYFSMETFIMLLFMALAHCVNIILELFFVSMEMKKWLVNDLNF